MMNVYDYVKKYGDLTFKEKKFNEIDNLVFSLLAYLNYTSTSINIKNYTLEYIGKEYLKLNDYKTIRKLGIAQRDAYKLLKEVINLKRYKDVIIHDYIYNTNINKQFSAMMFKISKNLEYICFEGTDELISGWKEDLYLACIFPTLSQKDAIIYANNHIKVNGPKIIIGGHSKGGNLALVASMYTKAYKQFKILKVYSNDGPGLRLKEFNSKFYKKIKKKLVHFVPEYCMIGVLLRNDVYDVIKSSKNNIFAHAISTWLINDDKLVSSSLSNKSLELEKNVISWLENHSDYEKEKLVTEIFNAIEKANIKSIQEVSDIKKLFKLIENLKNIDDETKNIIKKIIKERFSNKSDDE